MSENRSSESSGKPPEPEPSEAETVAEGAVEPSEPLSSGELDRLLNIEIPIIAVMGEKIMTLNDVLNLTIGSIVQLDKPAEEHLDLMVNNQCIGKGQTVRTGDNFGLQITELIPVRETIRKLGMKDDIPDAAAESGSKAEESR